jgi:plasmid stability protein
VATLLVRDVDDSLIAALKARAAKHKRSAEAEHREILAAALAGSRRRSFAEVLASMPNVGQDTDFERPADNAEAPRVFD